MKNILKKLKKYFLIVLIIVIVTIILSLFQYLIYYYNNPLEEQINFTRVGYIIYYSGNEEFEKVDVEFNGKKLTYLFKNHAEAIQGDIFVNGYSIFGNDRNHETENIGFYTEFHNEKFASVGLKNDEFICRIISISKDFKSIVCGLNFNSFEKEGKEWYGQALLVIPENQGESIEEVMKNALSNSVQMRDWFIENGWEKKIETEKKDNEKSK